MAKLYDIAQNISQLEELLENMDENDATFEGVKQYLDSLVDVDLTQKVDNIVKFIKNIEAEADMYKSEKERLEKLQKQKKKQAENLKTYLADTLKAIGYNHVNKKKVQTTIGTVSFKKNPPALEIVDLSKVPTEFDKPLEREIKKSELLKYAKEIVGDLKNVDSIVLEDLGVKIVNDNSSLQIK